VFRDAEVPYITMGAACRMTGLSGRQLRRCHAQGWLTPAGVSERTGHRHYSRADVEDLRLYAALIATGMPAVEAGQVLVTRDGGRVLDHVESLAEHEATLRRLTPPPRGARVRRLRLPAEQVLVVSMDAAESVEHGLDAWTARAAAHGGTGTLQLPRAERGQGLPDGPAACIPAPGSPVPDAEVWLHLPWDDQPPPDGMTPHSWWGSEGLVCDLSGDVDLPAAHQALDCEVERLRLIDMGRRLLFTPGRQSRVLTPA
jgi:DNA-binding transcriptional MerR regulator